MSDFMDLNEFYYFAMVVKHSGFSAAERVTNISKAKLSRRVAALEKKLGLRLLQRNSRGLALTEAGYAFYMRCLAVVEEAEIASIFMMKMKDSPSGTVRLSCPGSLAQLYLAPILPDFMTQNPQVDVVVIETNRPMHLIEERIDIAILGRPNPEVHQGLITRNIMDSRMFLAASPRYFDRHDPPLSPEDLSSAPTISSVGDKLDGLVVWELFGPDNRRETIEHHPCFRSRDITLQLHAALKGTGLALMPEPVIRPYLRDGSLRRILPEWSSSNFTIKVAFLARRGLLPSVRTMLDFLVENLPRAFAG